MIAPPTNEFLVIAAVVGTATWLGAYMAARRDRRPMEQEEDAFVEQLTFEDALANREKVLAEVAADNSGWMAAAIEATQKLPNGEVGTGEDIRRTLLDGGLRPPRHPNVWGALLNALGRRGIITPTGEYRPMKSKSSNGRRTPVYLKVAAESAA